MNFLKALLIACLAMAPMSCYWASHGMAKDWHGGGGVAKPMPHAYKPGWSNPGGHWRGPAPGHWRGPAPGHWYKPWSWGHPRPQYYPPSWWVPGVLGGLILGGILNGKNVEAFSQEWYEYCVGKYKSFNPETGKYLGYDGEYHFCRVQD